MNARILTMRAVNRGDQFRAFLESVTADLADTFEVNIDGFTIHNGDEPGALPLLRIPTSTGYVDVWDGAEVGERGVFIQAFENVDVDSTGSVFFGDMTRVLEGGSVGETSALINCYLGGPSVAGRRDLLALQSRLARAERELRALQVEQVKLQPEPQQPRLISSHSCRIEAGQVT